jgi:hypothetical protein
MGFSNALGARAHDAMHRLPGMPDHDSAGELNTHRHQRALPNRPLRNRPSQNPNGHHQRAARLFPRWQAWIGRRFQQGQR